MIGEADTKPVFQASSNIFTNSTPLFSVAG